MASRNSLQFYPGPVLGIETSCDDTAAAVVDGGRVLSSVVSSQMEHRPFQGVVPELASRAHVRLLGPVVSEALRTAGLAWKDVRGVAATHAPGLLGSLLVGLTYAKAAAAARELPFVGVNHLEAHLLSVLIDHPEIEPPLIALLASGGHSEIVECRTWHRYTILGSTRDDAAGEAFDKVAILLGMGFPGGPAIDRAARQGRADAIPFPRAWLEPESLDFSFSGLKTAVRNAVRDRGGAEALDASVRNDVAASFQEAVTEVLAVKTLKAAERVQVRTVLLAGGVAANSVLRGRLESACRERGWVFAVPALRYCGDNGAMVAFAGSLRLARGERSSWSLSALPTLTESRFGGNQSGGR
ncbi:MAG TPA: tRNA (adenosine(37)-N6)-threonylcarbamoyltransferase complex transferase subunit TsaD [Candidatus Eisenbacteria bacterium]|nr:tRNA (adenosine(37)-N6)-threonylcarbamoyltransferase complex transferase subunit TsaD [Candidatus Eisenbacteria bacterium]